MNQQKIFKLIKEDKEQGVFDFEVIADTWQISYVRFAGAEKKSFESVEHFYFSLMKSDMNPTSGYVNQAEWIERVDWNAWCQGLSINKVNEEEFRRDLKNAMEEIKEAEPEQDRKFDDSRIKFPNEIINCWSIEESMESRHPVGATWSFLVETNNDFFYLERHWES